MSSSGCEKRVLPAASLILRLLLTFPHRLIQLIQPPMLHTRLTQHSSGSSIASQQHLRAWKRIPRARSRVCRAAAEEAEPVVTLKFLPPEGAEQITVVCPSGEQLRACMLDNKVDLYTTWGKIWSCGGAGQCGTCIVEVVEGGDILSERTATEEKKLNKKPGSWRLACQTIVGDGSNSGSVVIKTKPQGK